MEKMETIIVVMTNAPRKIVSGELDATYERLTVTCGKSAIATIRYVSIPHLRSETWKFLAVRFTRSLRSEYAAVAVE